MDIFDMDIKTLSDKIKSREITSHEVCAKYIEKIEKYEEKIGAFIHYDKEQILKDAQKIDEKIKSGGKVGKLAGIPIAIKDNICTKDMPTTAASKMLENYISPYDATIIEKIKAEDGIILGKTNMDEFATGSTTKTSYFHMTHNPYDLEKVPGGSSGGSAAAVAADMAPIALGTDTGGSIRQPASYCGIYSIKPTYGKISRYGVLAYASSFDQVGPMGKSVEDISYMLDVLSFHDKKDTTSLDIDYISTRQHLKDDIKGKKIALPLSYFKNNVSEEIEQSILKTAENFQKLGAKVAKIDADKLAYSLPAYYILTSSEASSNFAKFDSIGYGYRSASYENLEQLYKNTRAEGFGEEVKRRIFLGVYMLSAQNYEKYFVKAAKVRRIVKNTFDKIFNDFDAILTPVTSTTAPKIDGTDTPVDIYRSDKYTIPANVAGLPALTMPCGYDKDGMPIGMQLIGNHLEEKTILNLAYKYEKEYKEQISKKAVIK